MAGNRHQVARRRLFHAPAVRIIGMGQQACRSIRWAPIFATSLLMAAFAYPLSTGPAIFLYGAPSCPLRVKQVMNQIYDPLFREPVPDRVRVTLHSWIDLWDFYGAETSQSTSQTKATHPPFARHRVEPPGRGVRACRLGISW
jgi:hypothetical protein